MIGVVVPFFAPQSFRRTAARWLGIVATIYLLPVTTASLLAASEVRLPPEFEGFAASPVQIMLLLIGGALVLTLVRRAGRRAGAGAAHTRIPFWCGSR